MMEEEEERRFYANYANHLQDRGMVGGDSAEKLYETTMPDAIDRVTTVRPYLNSDMRMVEIGASAGAFCGAARDHVAKVVGVEPSPEHAAHLMGLGIKVVPYLDELDPSEKFGAAAFFHVLEHMRKPVQFLRDIRNLLQPNGYVFVEVPNVQDALLSVYQHQKFAEFYYQTMHCIYFSPKTLEDAFKAAGFSTVELIPKQRYDLSNHMTWLQTGNPGGMGRFSEVFTPELENAYASNLKERWVCDTIFGVFRRN